MRVTFRCILPVLAVCLAYPGPGCAEEANPGRDITCTSGYTRLHAVTDELSSKAGVQIYAGRNGADWQVRDIPLVVCARDMPLDRLLRAIADAAHLDIKATETASGVTYRIWRGGDRGRKLERCLNEIDKAVTARRCWEWDVLAGLRRVSDASLKRPADGKPIDANLVSSARNLSGILSALGTNGRNKVLRGEVIHMTLADAPPGCNNYLPDLILDVYRRDTDIGGLPSPEESDKRMAQCGLVIRREEGHDANIQVRVRLDKWGLSHPVTDRINDLVDVLLPDEAIEAAGMPARPAFPPIPAPDLLDPGLEPIAFDGSSELLLLDTKVQLTCSKNGDLRACDLLAALSEATGYSVVCEDFLSHRKSQPDVGAFFQHEVTVGQVLKHLSSLEKPDGRGRLLWYVNSADKLIVGCAADWPIQHRDLAADSLVTLLKSKLNGGGVDLDEWLLYAYMDYDQREQWVHDSRDLSVLEPGSLPHLSNVWRFYTFLSPEERALAKSAEGLSMARMDPGKIRDMLRVDWEDRRLYIWMYPDTYLDPQPVVDPSWSLILKVNSPPYYPSVSMVDFHDEETVKWWNEHTRQTAGKHYCDLEISYYVDGELHNLIRRGGPPMLPICSPKRQQEVIEQWQKSR